MVFVDFLLVSSGFQPPERPDLGRRGAGYRRASRGTDPKSRISDGLGRHLSPWKEPVGVCAPEFEDQQPSLYGRDGKEPPPVGPHDFWRRRVDLPTGRGPGTQGI